ncbi:unnamed protein product [Aureobasidium pullulans]|nr:unnamed protein product [Aureobasidium pullulans]
MFAEVANYANDAGCKLLYTDIAYAAAVEKSLRLLQAFVQIAAGTTSSVTDAKTWNMARGHFALDQCNGHHHLSILDSFTTSCPPSLVFCYKHLPLLTTHDYLSQNMSSATLASNLVLDCCDILIPGSAVGWIPVDSVTVGIASSISSIIAGQQIWARVQKEAKEKEMRKREKSMRKVRFEKGTKVSEEEREGLSEKGGKEEASNGVVDGSVKVLANAAGGANGGVKKRSKKT